MNDEILKSYAATLRYMIMVVEQDTQIERKIWKNVLIKQLESSASIMESLSENIDPVLKR